MSCFPFLFGLAMVLLLFVVLIICRGSGYMMLVSKSFASSCVYVSVCMCVLLQSDLSRVVQSALFVSGINTLLQTVLGSRLPAVMGNSFYFLSITLSIVNAPSIIQIPDPHEVSKPYSPSLSLSLSPIISTNAQHLHPLQDCCDPEKKCTASRAPEESNKYTVKSYSCLHNK